MIRGRKLFQLGLLFYLLPFSPISASDLDALAPSPEVIQDRYSRRIRAIAESRLAVGAGVHPSETSDIHLGVQSGLEIANRETQIRGAITAYIRELGACLENIPQSLIPRAANSTGQSPALINFKRSIEAPNLTVTQKNQILISALGSPRHEIRNFAQFGLSQSMNSGLLTQLKNTFGAERDNETRRRIRELIDHSASANQGREELKRCLESAIENSYLSLIPRRYTGLHYRGCHTSPNNRVISNEAAREIQERRGEVYGRTRRQRFQGGQNPYTTPFDRW